MKNKSYVGNIYRDTLYKLSTNIYSLIKKNNELHKSLESIYEVDGTTIGEGRKDTTREEIEYELEFNGKNFLMLDMPGIEGDEKKYIDIIKKSVSRSHLVLYTYTSQKKPEIGTLEKIKSNLNDGSVVYTLCNAFAKADTYENTGIDKPLEIIHDNAYKILEQTSNSVKKVLGNNYNENNNFLVQGLLAFSSLSVNKKYSTIHRDMVVLRNAQKRFLECFEYYEYMKKFSNIENISNILKNKISTFDEDIIKINKNKIIVTVNKLLDTLIHTYDDMKIIYNKVLENVRDTNSQIDEIFSNFIDKNNRQIANELKSLFSTIEDKINNIIEANINDKNIIKNEAENTSKEEQEKFKKRLDEIIKENTNEMEENIKNQIDRLNQDIKDIFLIQSYAKNNESALSLEIALQTLEFKFKDFADSFLNIASFALSGLIFGIPGLIIGTILGIIVEFFKYFAFTKKGKIEKMKKQINEEISRSRKISEKELENNIANMHSEIEKKIREIKDSINEEPKKIENLCFILSEQIKKIKEIKYNLEGNNYGKI